MLSIKRINEKDIDLCFDLDSKTTSLWSRNQWVNEFEKEYVKVYGLLLSNEIIGICVFQIILDEAQINFFVINQRFRKRGFGSYLMSYLIKSCQKQAINKLLLEVSHKNVIAENFYKKFDFYTVGIRRKYYKDGSDALLKEKDLTKNNF